ncbi:MAG: segregation and condensation protein A [bacterium]
MQAEYSVYSPEFQGPLDSLLEAARCHDVQISRVNIARLIEQFAIYVEQHSDWPVNSVSAYLLVFSELIRIKSRLLLPKPEIDEEIEELPDREGREFFITMGRQLREKAKQRARLYDTSPDLPEYVQKGETRYKEVTLFELIRAFQKIVVTRQEKTNLPDFQFTNEFDTGERMEFIVKLVRERDMIAFEKLVSATPSREEVIVTFLAILQLVKQNDLRLVREIDAEQIYVTRYNSGIFKQ